AVAADVRRIVEPDRPGAGDEDGGRAGARHARRGAGAEAADHGGPGREVDARALADLDLTVGPGAEVAAPVPGQDVTDAAVLVGVGGRSLRLIAGRDRQRHPAGGGHVVRVGHAVAVAARLAVAVQVAEDRAGERLGTAQARAWIGDRGARRIRAGGQV